ncbi:hypothetical protein [Thomasclavelia cocleata]|jgi:hypothetical protein|uniref:hypothetical protein n=1 Tax=Thomasclavelia cocleata TaxID=69824 RepID=UPI00255AA308|nr:hypothetical protein [Thomasclavelia cocleata]
MSKVLDYLMKEDVKIVFDVDGVLAPFEFGELKHNGCKDEDWENFVIENKPYDNIRSIPQLKQFINDKGLNNVYACSVSAPYEEKNKRDFVVREYGIPVENIKFVCDKKDKIHFLKQLAKETKDESKVAIVEDTVSTLNQIFDTTDFITVHISSFFFN